MPEFTLHEEGDALSENRKAFERDGFVYLSTAAREDRKAVEAYRRQLAEDRARQGRIWYRVTA